MNQRVGQSRLSPTIARTTSGRFRERSTHGTCSSAASGESDSDQRQESHRAGCRNSAGNDWRIRLRLIGIFKNSGMRPYFNIHPQPGIMKLIRPAKPQPDVMIPKSHPHA